MAGKKKVVEETAVEVDPEVTLESIELNSEARQQFAVVLEHYKKKNPVKYESKRAAFIKKMLSL
jgi:hypothetical protein